MAVVFETGFTGTTYPTTTPRIGAFPIAGTVVVSTEATGFAGINAANELTWSFWKPTAFPATWELDFTSQAVSYAAIASHNLATVGGTVTVQEWTGAAWVAIAGASATPTDNGPLFFLFASRTTDRLRVRFTNAIPTIGVIWFGRVTELPQKAVYADSVPFNEALQSSYTDTLSDGGHVLGRFVSRRAQPCAMTVNNLSEAWAAANVPALQAHMESLPIFLADRPADYPKSVVFGSVAEPLRLQRTLAVYAAARSLSLSVMGHNPQ